MTAGARRRAANGEGSISYDESRQRYVGRITIGRDQDGRLVRKKFVGRTRSDVVARMAEARKARDGGLNPPNDRLTTAAFLASWLDGISGSVAESTEAAYRTRVRLYINPAVGAVPLTRLTPGHVHGLLAEMEARGLSGETRRLTRAVLRRALRRAEQEGLLVRNVAAIADGPRVTREEGRTLTPEEARRLLAAAMEPPEVPASRPGARPRSGQRLHAAILVTLALGLRRGEALGMRWTDLDLEGDPPTLSVLQQLIRRPNGRGLALVDLKTRKARRVIVLPTAVVAALRSHRARQAEERLLAGETWCDVNDLVFTTATGTPVDPRNFNKTVSTVARQAGLGHWHPHELRHSAASLLLAMGVRLEVVSEVLGHSSIRVTKDVYGHLLPEAKREAADAMDSVFDAATNP